MKRFFIFSFLFLLGFSSCSFCSEIVYSGVVVNDIGRFAANATISIENYSTPGQVQTAVTDTTGKFSFKINTDSQDKESPFRIIGNYPEPFFYQTKISYSVDKELQPTVKIYDKSGKCLRTIYQDKRLPGFYDVVWNGRDESLAKCEPGIYFCSISDGGRTLYSTMYLTDEKNGKWIGYDIYPTDDSLKEYKNIFKVSIIQTDATPLYLGPLSINDSTDKVIALNRIMDKMINIEPGLFTMGHEFYRHSQPLHRVKISHNYLIDKYETTNEIFCKVMNHALSRGAVKVSGNDVKNTEGDSEFLFKLDTPDNQTNVGIIYKDGKFVVKDSYNWYPVTYVSWFGAVYFCYERNIMEGLPQTINLTDWSCDFKAAGYRLPTEAEREYAGKRPNNREYPYGEPTGLVWPMNTQLNEDGFEEVLSPVGWFSPQGDTYDGISDLAGNVYEWLWDWMSYYNQAWVDSLLVDPTGASKGVNKVARGGSAYGCFRAGRNGDRANLQITRIANDTGFRTVIPSL